MHLVTARHGFLCLFGALFLVVLATQAEASGARIRWSASTDARVAGYHVYVRGAGTPYGAPLDAGRPAPAADGSLSYSVSGLTAGQSYFFAVTAYTAASSTAASLESGFSGEIGLGTTNPCLIDRCTTPTSCEIRPAADGSSCDDGLFCNGIAVCSGGVCQNGPAPNCVDGVACTNDHCDEALARCVHVSIPGCCQSDADCADSDACTGGEHCVSGTCVSLGAVCPASSCADAFCDPRSGCGLMPTPDGVSCDEFCDVLVPRRLALGAFSGGATLNLRSTFQSGSAIDPSAAGFELEIADATGAVIYKATVPPDLFETRGSTKFRYLAKADAVLTGGISGIVLKQRKGAWALNVRAAAPALFDALGSPQIALTVRVGNACARDAQLACVGDSLRSARCR